MEPARPSERGAGLDEVSIVGVAEAWARREYERRRARYGHGRRQGRGVQADNASEMSRYAGS